MATEQKELELEAQETTFEKIRIPEDMYDSVFRGYKDVSDGQYGKRIALEFEVLNKGNPVILSTIIYPKWSKESKMGSILNGLGVSFEKGKKLKLSSLVGTQCRVLVEDYTDKENNTRSSIAKVLRTKEVVEERVQ